MSAPRIGIVGASGYSGAIAARLIASHPGFELLFATSDKLASRAVAGLAGARSELRFVPNASALELSAQADAILLATSAEVSLSLAPKLLALGKPVIDFSGAFRLVEPSLYPRWYGLEHSAPALLANAHYGLPELFGYPAKTQTLIANPGCYPTAALLALGPLISAGLIDLTQPIVVDGKSGVSGAGRQSREEYSFTEVAGDVRAYKLLSHQHSPEIAQSLGRLAHKAGGSPVHVVFTAHLVPVRRGLVTTCYARPSGDLARSLGAEAIVRAAYENQPFVEVVAPGEATMASVVGTNRARVGVAVEEGMIVAVGAIDNLLKGAAGQALQTLNAMFGFAAVTGLDGLQRSAP